MRFCRSLRLLVVPLMVLSSLHVSAQEVEVSGSRDDVRHSGDVVSVLLPAAALAAVLLQEDWEGLKEAAFSCATTLATTIVLKQVVDKRRPDHSDYKSFPSRHAALGFATAVFVHERYGWRWAIPCYAAAGYVSWTRVYGKKHDWWDVAAGAAIGAGSSVLFTTPFSKKHKLTFVPIAGDGSCGIYASLVF